MEAVRIWLNGDRNYTTGVKLYNQLGDDPKLKQLFKEEYSEFKRKKLLESMESLLSAKKISEKKQISIEQVAIERVKAERILGKGWSEQMDEIEFALYSKWKPMFLEMTDLCTRIDAVARAGTKDPGMRKEAGVMAHRILDLDEECDDIYEQRDHYQKHKVLPERLEYGELCIDPKKIPVKLQNHKRYVREYKTKLKSNPEDVSAAEQLKKHEWYVEQYEKMIL